VKVVAPGKLILTGAYAVLEGAPAIVVAVNRYAIADTNAPDKVDVSALQDEKGTKLGLGSSSASVVASLAARALQFGDDPRDDNARARLFRAAREVHARSQSGGSGADVAAAVHGGALRYALGPQGASVRGVDLPTGLVWRAFWSGTSARTSDLVARVDALRIRSRGVMGDLLELAKSAANAIDCGDALAFAAVAGRYGRALDVLGRAADAPIVPPAFAELAMLAESEGGAFLPSGAGGGDVAVWLSSTPPSVEFVARAGALSMRPLLLGIDRGGVRPNPGP
jgi:phosphomevalonate kinase